MNQGQLEGRLASLEAQVGMVSPRLDRAEPKLSDLAERMARIEERVSHLPTKGFIVNSAIGTVGAICSFFALLAYIEHILVPSVK